MAGGRSPLPPRPTELASGTGGCRGPTPTPQRFFEGEHAKFKCPPEPVGGRTAWLYPLVLGTLPMGVGGGEVDWATSPHRVEPGLWDPSRWVGSTHIPFITFNFPGRENESTGEFWGVNCSWALFSAIFIGGSMFLCKKGVPENKSPRPSMHAQWGSHMWPGTVHGGRRPVLAWCHVPSSAAGRCFWPGVLGVGPRNHTKTSLFCGFS